MSSYPSLSDERLKALYDSFTKGARPIEELLNSTEQLKGADAQVLRSKFSSYGLHPADCDDFELVAALMTANLTKLKERFSKDTSEAGGGEEGRQAAVRKWEAFRDSPNKLPVVDILQVGAFTTLSADGNITDPYFDALRWMVAQGISVEGRDVAGYTALQHSLSCTGLHFDLKWSKILLAASKDPIAAINNRNRYGATAAHECCMCYMRPGEEEIRLEVLTWMMDRGANVDSPSTFAFYSTFNLP